jgi:glutathione synthase
MDPITGINIDEDSTFALMEAAQSRGYPLFHYEPYTLQLRNGVVTATGHDVTVRREYGNHYTFGPRKTVDLSDYDVVLLRQDPPFDLTYVTTTHILDHIHPKTLVVNDPSGVRNSPEKLLITHFPDLMPPTLVTADPDAIRAFRQEHKDIILKPLYGNGGAGVFRLREDDQNLNAMMEMFFARSAEPLMVQAYLPAVRAGDKRIIMIDGEAAGAVNRVPEDGEARANLHVGGSAAQTKLTAREQEMCARLGPELKARGLIFVGLDVIGDYVTEINVTSPTCLQEIARLDGLDLASQIWDAIERKVAKTA